MTDSGFVDLGGVSCEWHECITCGVRYTVPKKVIQQQRDYGGFHYCSNGHSQGWGDNAANIAKVRAERDKLRQDNTRLADEAAKAAQMAIAADNRAKRLTKRAAAGTCPCCNRTFGNMTRAADHEYEIAKQIREGKL
jgi:hypothetical protein